jgi:hypothetical protein
MLWLVLLLGWLAPGWLIYYLPLLLFLGLGLRPLLEITGAYELFSRLQDRIEETRWKKITEERRLEVERKARDKKYKSQRQKDPRLPPNWWD